MLHTINEPRPGTFFFAVRRNPENHSIYLSNLMYTENADERQETRAVLVFSDKLLMFRHWNSKRENDFYIPNNHLMQRFLPDGYLEQAVSETLQLAHSLNCVKATSLQFQYLGKFFDDLITKAVNQWSSDEQVVQELRELEAEFGESLKENDAPETKTHLRLVR